MVHRKLAAEALGTALLVFLGVGVATLSFGFKLTGQSTSAGVVATAESSVRVGAGAVVSRNLPADLVAGGVPARVLRGIGEEDRVEVPRVLG